MTINAIGATQSSSSVLIREEQLLRDYVPVSTTTLRRKIKAGEFPKPVMLFDKIRTWRLDEVTAWLKANGV